MSKAFNAALDFMPDAKTGHGGFWHNVGRILEALAEGRQAQADYCRLTARGVEPTKAAGMVFDQNFTAS